MYFPTSLAPGWRVGSRARLEAERTVRSYSVAGGGDGGLAQKRAGTHVQVSDGGWSPVGPLVLYCATFNATCCVREAPCERPGGKRLRQASPSLSVV